MFIFLALGVLIGSLSVIFFLQNTEPTTVLFLTWQIEGLLGIILMLAFAAGVVMTVLFSLPSYISDWIEFSRLRRQIHKLEEDLHESRKREDAARAAAQNSVDVQPGETVVISAL